MACVLLHLAPFPLPSSVLATTNYVGMRTGAAITAAMDLADRASREAERASRRLRQQQEAAGGGGSSKGPGWSKMFKRRGDGTAGTGVAMTPSGTPGVGAAAAVPAAAAQDKVRSEGGGGSDGGSGVSGTDSGK